MSLSTVNVLGDGGKVEMVGGDGEGKERWSEDSMGRCRFEKERVSERIRVLEESMLLMTIEGT